ncbi:MAG: RIP metalloprotease RseP [Bacteroidales bacterium]|nr:RIP metalloprotease RseP [Candidatus Liminaster caballi]
MFWFKAFELIACFSILVFVHELGHFMWARFFKVGVEKFYLFFDAYNFALLRWNKKGLHLFDLVHFPHLVNPSETEYGIGWVPLGGYCAIVGMIDETHDAEHADTERPDAFVKQGKFAQFMIMVGGVLNNVLLAVLIYIGIAWYWGTDVLRMEDVPNATYSQYAEQIGFRQGDVIVSIDGDESLTYDGLANALLLGNEAVVRRGDELVNIALPDTLGTYFLRHPSELKKFLHPEYPLVISALPDEGISSPARDAGLLPNDSVIAVVEDSVRIATPMLADVQQYFYKHAGDSLDLVFVRNGEEMQTTVVVGADSLIGVALHSGITPALLTHIDYSLLEAIPAGVKRGWNTLYNYVRQFKLVFTKEGAKSVGGFGTMGSIFPEHWIWEAFWSLTAFISVALAFMNILPIPALDGGHIMILIIEAIIRRPLSDKLKDRLQYIGFGLVILLMLAANINDIIRFLL